MDGQPLSAKDIKNKVLADCRSLTAESSIQKLVVSGGTLLNNYLSFRLGQYLSNNGGILYAFFL
jgi:hydrogenase maturation factor HypF (carbamoyltransferase family)